MRRERCGGGLVVGAELLLDVDLRRVQPLAHGALHHGAHALVVVHAAHVVLQELEVAGEVKVEVLHRAQLGARAGERALGRDKLLGLVLVAEVALVGVGLLRLAALNGAAADHLATVQKLPCLGVVELLGRELLDHAALLQAPDDLVGDALVHGRRGLERAAAVDVAADLEVLERLGLLVVVLLHVVGDALVVALGLHALAVALHDGGAVAVGARGKDHVLAADAVAQEPSVKVGGHKDAAHMAEVQPLVAVRLAGGNDGAAGKRGTGVLREPLGH